LIVLDNEDALYVISLKRFIYLLRKVWRFAGLVTIGSIYQRNEANFLNAVQPLNVSIGTKRVEKFSLAALISG
jgi:hypothetical protein